MKINGTIKYTKTVLSHITQLRNLFGNIGFATINGHWNITKGGKIPELIYNRFKNPKEYQKYMLKMARLNLIGQDVRGGELKKIFQLEDEGNLIVQQYSQLKDSENRKNL